MNDSATNLSTNTAKTVLVVDDEPDICDLVSSELKDNGHNVLVANCGNDALEIAKNNHIDLILSDMRMARGTGAELLSKLNSIRSLAPRPVIVFFTGYSDIAPEEAYDMGASAFITKPLNFTDLISSIDFYFQNTSQKLKRYYESKDIKVSISVEFDSTSSKKIRIGSGGAFIGIDGTLPFVNDLIFLTLTDTSNKFGKIEGATIVRWIRKKNSGEFLRGIGVEFFNLTNQSIENLQRFPFPQPATFIPIK